MRGRTAAMLVLLLVVVALSAIWYLAGSGSGNDARIPVTIRLSNIDDSAVVYVGCEQRAAVRFPNAKTVRLRVRPDEVITIQVDNDRNGFAWRIEVRSGGRTLLVSADGVAGVFGADGNNLEREYDTVFNHSMRADGSKAQNPACVRV